MNTERHPAPSPTIKKDDGKWTFYVYPDGSECEAGQYETEAAAKDAQIHGQAGATKAKAATATVEDTAQTLQILLANISESELAKHLSAAPTACTPAQLKSLLSILKTLGMDVASARALSTASAADPLHCVRCHKTYTEKKNGLKACVITHDGVDAEFVGRWPHEYLYECGQCGLSMYDDEGEFPEVCFEGRHTTDPEEVEYGGTTEECEDIGCFD